MTYSSLSQNLPQLLRQPTSIATVVSVAFHGILGIALPMLPSSGSGAIPEAVDIVELSAVEQGRLPSIANSPMILPPNDAANLFSTLPSDLNTSIPPVPSVTSTLDMPPVPAAPKFEIVPPPDLKNWPYLQIPTEPSITNVPLEDFLATPVLPPPPKQDLAALPPEIFLPPTKSPTFDLLPKVEPAMTLPPALVDGKLPQPQAQVESPPQQAETQQTPSQQSPEEIAQEQRLREEQQQRQAGALGEEIALGTPLPQASPGASPQPSSEAASQPSPEASPQAAPPVDERVAQAYARQQEIREKLAYNSTGTTPEDATANLETWLAQIKKSSGKEDLTWEMQKQEVVGTYPKLACLSKLEGTAMIGVLVSPEGKIVGEPQLIQSSGYPILNQSALEAVASHSFGATGEHKAYPVNVKFQLSKEQCAGTPSIQETVEEAVS